MAQTVYDTDKHFVINPVTREILSESGKSVLIQHDHNSERFTFEIPKLVDGHDMSLCNLVQVHYLNVDGISGASYNGVYKIEDLRISTDNPDVVIGSWLVSRNATQNVGSLYFIIRFACIDDSGYIEYDWRTAICKKLYIGQGIDNSEIVDDTIKNQYPDVLAQWETTINSVESNISSIINEDLIDLGFNIATSYTSENFYNGAVNNARGTWQEFSTVIRTRFIELRKGFKVSIINMNPLHKNKVVVFNTDLTLLDEGSYRTDDFTYTAVQDSIAVIQIKNTDGSDITPEDMTETVVCYGVNDALKSNAPKNYESVYDFTTTKTLGYLTSNGALISDNVLWNVTEKISVNEHDYFIYSGITDGNPNAYSAFYDLEGNFISSFTIETGEHVLEIPNGVSFVAFSLHCYDVYHFCFWKRSTIYFSEIPKQIVSANSHNSFIAINNNDTVEWDTTVFDVSRINESFESDTHDYTIVAGTPIISSDAKYSGTKSLKCFGETSTHIKFRTNFPVGKTYIAFMLKVDRYASGGGAGIQYPDEVQKLYNYKTDGWVLVSRIISFDSEVEKATIIGTMGAADCDAYIDNIIILNLPSVAGDSITYDVDGSFTNATPTIAELDALYLRYISETAVDTVPISKIESYNLIPEFPIISGFNYFIELMGDKCDEIGIKSNKIKDVASGLEISTKEMVRLGLEAYTYPELMRIWGTKTKLIRVGGESKRDITIISTVQDATFEASYEILGGKTGSGVTECSLLLIAKNNNGTAYIGAISGATSYSKRWSSMKELFDIATEYENDNSYDLTSASVLNAPNCAIAKLPVYGSIARNNTIDFIFTQNGDVKNQIYSVTKVLSAIVMLDHIHDMDKIVTFDSIDTSTGSGAYFETGDRITMRDGLYAMMLPSSNITAKAMARTIGAEFAQKTARFIF